MNRKILLTGRPGCGKTTVIKPVAKELALPVAGFHTEETRERGQRVGFKIVTLAGEEAALAHVDFKTPPRVGKYGLDLSGLETTRLRKPSTAGHQSLERSRQDPFCLQMQSRSVTTSLSPKFGRLIVSNSR